MTIPKGLYIKDFFCEDIKYELNDYDYSIDVKLYNINNEKHYKIYNFSRKNHSSNKNKHSRKKNNIKK